MSIDTGLLLIRVAVGLILAAHGAQKLFGWFGGYGLRSTGNFLGMTGLKPGVLWAFLGGLSEFGGGLAFALGFLTPLGSIGVIAAMATAAPNRALASILGKRQRHRAHTDQCAGGARPRHRRSRRLLR